MPNRIIELLRTTDLLVLEFEFVNLDLFEADGELPVRFMRLDEAQPAFVIVRFPPQHLVERDFHEARTTADPLAPAPIESRIAGPSRLVFRIPDTIPFIPYSVSNLLDWSGWEPSVAPLAAPPGAASSDFDPLPAIAAPLPEHTAIELPYRLFLSPHAGLGWTHAPEAVTRAGRTELWHTRLGVRRDGGIDESIVAEQRTVRAIWTADLDQAAPPPVPWTLPNADQRRQIVRLTTDFSITRTIRLPNGLQIVVSAYTPDPVQVNRLMLSALGGWLDGRGAWAMSDSLRQREGLSVEEWRHITAMGRDEFVRIVLAGYAYPFGHRASHVIELERKFEAAPTPGSPNFGAYLRRHDYTVIREPLKTYPPARYPNRGLEMPLRRAVRILTLQTPFLDDPTIAPSRIANTGGHAFWMRVDNRDFPFHVRAEDPEGGHVEFSGALIFVDINATPAEIEVVRAAYRDDARRREVVPGQKMVFAERLLDEPGETALTTSNLYFDTVTPVVADTNQASFVPLLDKADVRIPALEQILNAPTPVTIQLHDAYKSGGLAAPTNQGRVFARVVGTLPLRFPSDRAGGLASPSMDITGISQTLGPVSGNLADLDGGTFNPAAFFSRNDATLLGGVKLRDVIDAVFDPLQFPRMVIERLPASVVTTLDWKPRVRVPSVVPSLEVSAATSLDLNTRIEKKLDGAGDGTTLVTGVMRTFAINFLGVARVRFDSVSFRSQPGQKLDFSAELDAANPVEFLGALSFVNELRRFIPSSGFSDPPAISVSPTAVEVGYTLALPPLAVGVFALQNVSLSAGLSLPFTGDPARLRFGFAERHAPFLLTVSLFGGGGFFGMAVGLDKVVLVEAALEFGGSISLNLGVASGGVYVMAGIYFKLEGGVAELAGYLRCGGSLEVLGLICISIEFYLELGYKAGKARGLARVTVKVEIACFSKSVTLTVEKSFGGSSGDPTFGELIEPDDWIEYGNAFA